MDVPLPGRGRALLVPHRCLKCQSPLHPGLLAMQCAACGAECPLRDGVPFYSSADYFGEVSQAEMGALIQLASQPTGARRFAHSSRRTIPNSMAMRPI